MTNSVPSRKGNSLFGLTPTLAWVPILALIILTAVFTVAGAGKVLRPLFPLGSLGIGILLYLRYPVLYLGFTWWLWMLTPLVARLVDYQSGWDPQRLMLVAPYLVSLLTLTALVRHLPSTNRQNGLPFVLCTLGIIYGTLIGLVQFPLLSVFRALLDWLTPISFSFYLFVHWRRYPDYCKNIQRVFGWGVLVTGAYGIYQYLVAPMWDRYWLNESGMFTSAGSPVPLGMRVWSTMHSPGPFANFMLAGLLILFASQFSLRIPAMVVGYLSFLLSLVRSSWGSWVIGLLSIATALKPKLQMRLILTIVVMAICVVPLVTVEPFAGVITKRLETISNIQNDGSFQARQGIYEESLGLALRSWLGSGIGSTWQTGDDGSVKAIVVDSGIIESLLTIGWIGAVPYFVGLIWMMFKVLLSPFGRSDAFMSAARAIALSLSAQLIFGNSITGLSGVLMWSFLGISLAADKYYRYERSKSMN